MSKLLTGSICLSDIDKNTVTIAKNGKKYININVWINDEKDKYGNDASIQHYINKERRPYIGNLKFFEKQETPNSIPESNLDSITEEDDLPF